MIIEKKLKIVALMTQFVCLFKSTLLKIEQHFLL